MPPRRPPEHLAEVPVSGQAIYIGIRQPIVLILLLIALSRQSRQAARRLSHADSRHPADLGRDAVTAGAYAEIGVPARAAPAEAGRGLRPPPRDQAPARSGFSWLPPGSSTPRSWAPSCARRRSRSSRWLPGRRGGLGGPAAAPRGADRPGPAPGLGLGCGAGGRRALELSSLLQQPRSSPPTPMPTPRSAR